MADEDDDRETMEADGHRPRECMPCRGTGSVVSNLGGEPSVVPCPWCRGEGMRVPGVDAQERWLKGDA